MISAGSRVELLLLNSLPGIITLMLTTFCLTAKHVSGLSYIMPSLQLIPIFYWGMSHAREMPYWFVFVLGLVIDAVTGLPMLGFSSLMNLLFLGLVHAQRKYIHKEGFIIKWGYFALLLGVIQMVIWISLSLFFSQGLSIGPAMLQWLLTVGCYPAFHKCFDELDDRMHARRWKILHGR